MGVYCTYKDVAAFFGQGVARFTEDSLPAKETVEQVISTQEDFIDRYTRCAWRERSTRDFQGYYSVEEGGYEYHRLQPRSFYGFAWIGFPVFLKFRPVRPFDPDKGDSVQVFTGQGWEEWLGVRPLGPNKDWWVNWDDGIIYFRRMFWFSKLQGHTIRVRYRFGYDKPNNDIRYACILLTVAQLIESGDYTVLLPEGAQNIIYAKDKVDIYREKAMRILDLYKHVVVPD